MSSKYWNPIHEKSATHISFPQFRIWGTSLTGVWRPPNPTVSLRKGRIKFLLLDNSAIWGDFKFSQNLQPSQYLICYIILSSIKKQPWFSVNFRVCNMKLFIVFLAGFLASLSCNTHHLLIIHWYFYWQVITGYFENTRDIVVIYHHQNILLNVDLESWSSPYWS